MNEIDAFKGDEVCQLLLEMPKRDFWHYCNEEFTVSLIARIWPLLGEQQSAELTTTVIEGPPRDMFVKDLPDQEYQVRADWMRFRFLDAMAGTDRPLPPAASTRLDSLRLSGFKKTDASSLAQYQEIEGAEWGVPDHFSGDVDEYNKLQTPEMVEDVKRRVAENSRRLDLLQLWANRYTDRALDLADSLLAAHVEDRDTLAALIQGISLAETTSDGTIQRFIALIPRLTGEIRNAVAGPLSSWMDRFTKKIPITAEFLKAWDALVDVANGASWVDSGEHFTSAFSSPIGQLALVLLNRWIAASPKRGSGLNEGVRHRLERLLALPDSQTRRARTIIAAYLCPLHIVDRSWTQSKLVPLFEWSSGFAVEMWQGYLHNHRFYPDLLADLKPSLLAVLRNREKLGADGKGLLRFLAGVVVYSPASLSDNELKDSVQFLDSEGLAFLAWEFFHILSQAQASERRGIWERGIKRALSVWPLDSTLKSEELSGYLVEIAIQGADFFDEVASYIEGLLIPMNNIQMVLYNLAKTSLPEEHPRPVARVLSSITVPHGQQPYMDTEAYKLLLRMQTADPKIRGTPEFVKLEKTGWFDVSGPDS
jgi:hypothetical protein